MYRDNMQQQRRNFLKASLTLSATALLPAVQAAPVLLAPEEFAILVGPYLQTNFGNEMTILWLTSKAATGWIEFGEDINRLDQKAYGKTELGLKAANTRLNSVTIKNLTPDKTYYYRVFSKEIKDFQPYKLMYGNVVNTETQSFVNANVLKEEVSFLMLNDIHDRPKSIPLLVALDKGKANDFVFFNGDIFDYQTDEQQIIDNMLKPCVDSFAQNTPFIYVRGNHETRGKFAREFPNYFKNVTNTAFTLGPVRFVILDTGEDKEDSHPVYAGIVDFDQYRVEQANWFKEEIKTKAFKRAKFRIVMMHIPPRFSGDAHGPKHCTALFDPLLNLGKVDLVLSGHTHEYIIHQPNKKENTYPLVIGGGPKNGNRTLTKIMVDDKEIKVSMLDDSGKEVGNYTALRK